MTANNKYTILDDIANLLEKYSFSFPKPDEATRQSDHAKIQILWLALDHGLRTIRGMSCLLQDDENNSVLACILLRPFYELSVRLWWASRETEGWLRLFTYYAKEKKKWANGLKDFPNPGIVKIADDILQEYQEVANWTDSQGKPLTSAPNNIQQILDCIDQHDKKCNPSSSQINWGQVHYKFLYQILCRASHAHIETVTGELDRMYLSQSVIGASTATGNLILAFIHLTSQSAQNDVNNMLNEFKPIFQQCSLL